MRSFWNVAPSQMITVRSPLAEARNLPSGLNATRLTYSVWPRSVLIPFPVAMSQTLTVRSQPAEARNLPSGLKATPSTGPVWPSSR